MPNRILLTLDGSAMDEAAFSEAKRMAVGGAELHFLHVLPSRAVPVGTPLMGMMDVSASSPVAVGETGAGAQLTGGFEPSFPADALPDGNQVFDQVVRYLQNLRRRIPGVRGQDIVRIGEPADAILETALMFNIDLIVMSTHARTGIGRWFFGSVSDAVLRRSQLPVLLVRRGSSVRSEHLRRILVPLDGTAESRAILSVVKPLAARVNAELLLLEVLERAQSRWSGLSTRSASGEPGHDLQDFVRDLSDSGAAWESVTARGDPVEEILRHAQSRNADLIAMSTQARRGGRWFGRSVPEAVLARTDRAVLLQKPVAHAERSGPPDSGRRTTRPPSGPLLRT